LVSSSGRVPPDAAVFAAGADLEVVVAVTERGRAEAEARVDGRATVVVFPGGQVDPAAVVAWLHDERGVASVLCEGGPTLYGTFVAAGVAHDLFLTVAPILMGDASGRPPRPALVEGTAFSYHRPARLLPLSARRAGDHLFLRYHHAGPSVEAVR
jgi:riboflavin biosynthesis pyrimidine reductase